MPYCSEAARWKSRGVFFHIIKTLWVSLGDGAAPSAGPADMMGETARTPALGLVTRAPLSFLLKLYPNTCCHGDALDCKRLSGPRGLKTAHACITAGIMYTHIHRDRCYQQSSLLHPAGHSHTNRLL